MMNPCHGCTDRTITCHGVCRRYQDWAKENEEKKEWLRKQNPPVNERALKGQRKKIRQGILRGKRGGGGHYD